MSYLPRIVDDEAREALASAGALVLRGARAVGKTETARQVAASELRLDSRDPLAILAREQPSVALEGKTPRLLDEWQFAPGLWNEVRHAVDDRKLRGQFILSGSAVPEEDGLRHSGAGRFQEVMMRTMTLFETGHSTGAVSLRALLKGSSPQTVESETDFRGVVQRIVVGGWPDWIDASEAAAQQRAFSYLSDVSAHDFVQLAGTRRDPRRLMAYLAGVAALSAHAAPLTAVTRRVPEETNLVIPENAATELHDLGRRLFLIEDQPAWSPRLRSRSTAVQLPKRHLVDPSLAASLLGAGTARLISERDTLGHLFESQVVHDLRVYAQAAGTRDVFHFRDLKGRDEIDAVVEGRDGRWLAIEAKLGESQTDEAAKKLLRLAAKFERPPLASVVIVPAGVAYQRQDGVFVVPLTTLGP